MSAPTTSIVTAPPPVGGLRRAVRRTFVLTVWGAFGFLCVIGAMIAGSRPLGFETFAVLSGSMEPTLRVGDLVVDTPIRAKSVRVGDVVTFRDPENPTRLVTHRVRHIRVRQSTAHFVTRGDANSGVERWSMPLEGKLGRVRYAVPRLGYATARLRSRFGRLGLIALPALLLGLYELKRIWLPKVRR